MSIISAGGAVTGADAGPTIDPRDYFNTKLWTGTGSGQSITGMGFQPDLLWFKSRNNSNDHALMDAVRGRAYGLRSNSTATESSSGASNDLVSFDADGFTTGTPSNFSSLGSNGFTIVTWGWKADGAGSSNTDGSITSTVSVSATSGFSIVSYTGTGANATVGHGLGVAPSMIILKGRTNADLWFIWHNTFTSSQYIYFNTTAVVTGANPWNGALPTDTLFSLGTDAGVNGNTITYVAYCFAEISGFSKISSYTGNGSATGPSVTTGFEPTFLMIKRTDSTGDWIIHDSARDATNPRTEFLEPNTGDIEATGNDVDFNSTGFQIKSSSATVNATGGTYIYMCIA